MKAVLLVDSVRAFVGKSRSNQGLPERVTDPAVLARVAAVLLASENGSAGPLHKAGTTKFVFINTINATTTCGKSRCSNDTP